MGAPVSDRREKLVDMSVSDGLKSVEVVDVFDGVKLG